jgi:cytochrome c oxidase subunit 2
MVPAHAGIESPTMHPTPPYPRLAALVGAAVLFIAACGGDDASAPDGLSATATEGRTIAQDNGCAACHGTAGEGGIGPAWAGLAGSTVTLEDGSEIVADTDYLRRSILEPDADRVDGYTIEMPKADLDPAEVDALIAYIEALR